jgi:hypothetical protein
MKFAIFRRKVDEILPEFHRNVQEMKNCLDILRKFLRKIRKMLEISGKLFVQSFHFSFHFFIRLPSNGAERSAGELLFIMFTFMQSMWPGMCA